MSYVKVDGSNVIQSVTCLRKTLLYMNNKIIIIIVAGYVVIVNGDVLQAVASATVGLSSVTIVY